MRLIVHAGPGKTGTTAIQRSLLRAAPSLQQQGVFYLGLMLERAPVQLYPWQRPGGFDQFHKMPAAKARAELETVLRKVIAALTAGFHTLILSNESLLRREAVFLDVLEQLRSEGVDLCVIAYARGYAELARSAYVQWGLNHKTYAGPLKSFDQWMEGRELALSPSILRWREKLAGDFQVRNFENCDNVVIDFMEAVGLANAGVKALRVYETPCANELALRALFNEQQPGVVSPTRFTRLFESNKLAFDRPLGEWLRGLMPDENRLAEFSSHMAAERARINDLLSEGGQPSLEYPEQGSVPLQINSEAMLGTLFQIVAQQALKIETLEGSLAELHAAISSHRPEDAAPAQGLQESIGRDAIQAFAPGLGFFGALSTDNLQIAIPARQVSAIRLSLAEDKPTFLNLRGMELRFNGKPLQAENIKHVASQSTISGSEARNGPDCLLRHTGIHSAAEHAPWWEVMFDQPVEIDELRLSNRSDGWGSRSRSLAIDVTDPAGVTERLYDGQSMCSLRRVFNVAVAAADMGNVTLPATVHAAEETRHRIIDAIAQRIQAKQAAVTALNWRGIVPLLDVWGSHEPTDAEWTLIAAFLLSQQQAKAGTSIKSFSLLLHSQNRLLRLQQEINNLAAVLGLGGFMLTRHGVKPQGLLRREPERFVAHMEAVLRSLERMGRQPMLAYGTLLGAVREGHFIAHDDDIDLLYRSDARSRAEVEAELPGIKEELRVDGFKVVDLLPNSLNMHVIDARNGAVMDIFPCWSEGGSIQMHMESMKIRGIDRSIVYPPGSVAFMGRKLPSPAQPEAYLEERYGSGWRISDQFFEWPWALKDADGAVGGRPVEAKKEGFIA